MPIGVTQAQLQTIVEAVANGDDTQFATLCDVALKYDLCRTMTACRPGLWSLVRLRAGSAWHTIPLITRSVAEHIGRSGMWAYEQPSAGVPHGAGCVAVDAHGIWLADHLLYAAQDDLENGPDARFYGYLNDPVFSSMQANTHGWGYVQGRWFRRLCGADPRAGWMTSARWCFPVRAHCLPHDVLQSSQQQRLRERVQDVATLVPACVTDEPRAWWTDSSLMPAGEQLARWAQAAPRLGYGILTCDVITRREVHDPCAIPMLLAVTAPGKTPHEQAWVLLRRLVDLYKPNLLPVNDHEWRGNLDVTSPERLRKVGPTTIATTAVLIRALTTVALLPSYRSTMGPTDLPVNSVLRSGMFSFLRQVAIPVLDAQQARLLPNLSNLEWAWTESSPAGTPTGYQRVDLRDLAEALEKPGDCEVGGGLAYVAA